MQGQGGDAGHDRLGFLSQQVDPSLSLDRGGAGGSGGDDGVAQFVPKIDKLPARPRRAGAGAAKSKALARIVEQEQRKRQRELERRSVAEEPRSGGREQVEKEEVEGEEDLAVRRQRLHEQLRREKELKKAQAPASLPRTFSVQEQTSALPKKPTPSEPSSSSDDDDEEAAARRRALLLRRRRERSDDSDSDSSSSSSASKGSSSSSSSNSSSSSASGDDHLENHPRFVPRFVPRGQRKLDEERKRVEEEEAKATARTQEEKARAEQETRDRLAARVNQAMEDDAREAKQSKLAILSARENMPDDTDGTDEIAEFKAWELREMRRLKRDAEKMVAREQEQAETERRRNLTPEERAKEDAMLVESGVKKASGEKDIATRIEARRHHRGAFFMDEDSLEANDVRKRSLTGLTERETMHELKKLATVKMSGKRGQSRWKGLVKEDTSGASMWGGNDK